MKTVIILGVWALAGAVLLHYATIIAAAVVVAIIVLFILMHIAMYITG